MNGNHEAAGRFWRQVAEHTPAGGRVALLPHTAGLDIYQAQPGDEYQTVRRAFQAVLDRVVAQGDVRVRQDLERRGYELVSAEALRTQVMALGLGDTDWSRPAAVRRLAEALGAVLVVAGDFEFTITLVRRADGRPVGARQTVEYTLVALDGADGSVVARSPLTYQWESLLPGDQDTTASRGMRHTAGEDPERE